MSQPDIDPFAAPNTSSPMSPLSAGTGKITRTVAIIKHHALEKRFDIEPKILEASFEIVKERQMEFDTETDPDTLYELFGDDAATFNEGPVWVYVLERRRAVQVWQTVMGDPDPAIARENSPNSLRALFGVDSLHNAVMGSSDTEIAEMQIASLFASSPPFPTSDLPDEGQFDTMRSVGSSILSELQKHASDEGYAPSNATSPGGTSRRASITNGGKQQFKARPLPMTHTSPDIVPRTTRAAALRAGIAVDAVPKKPKVAPTKEQQKALFMDVPGHKRSGTISVASTAAPTIAPRMTRAASLRLGQTPVTPVKTRPVKSDSTQSPGTGTFEGVPGHKRRDSIPVSSTKAPTIAPRLNKSAALRTSGAPPPSSFMFRLPSSESRTPTLTRSLSRQSISDRPASAASMNNINANSRPTQPRSSSVISRPSASLSRASGAVAAREVTSPTPKPTAAPVAKPKPRLSTNTAPTIAPRTNKSALLRAAKMEEEAKAAAAKAKPKKPIARKSMMV